MVVMIRNHYLVTISWKGEVLEFYNQAPTAPQALHNAIRQLSRKVGYDIGYVRRYVMDGNYRRYEISMKGE